VQAAGYCVGSSSEGDRRSWDADGCSGVASAFEAPASSPIWTILIAATACVKARVRQGLARDDGGMNRRAAATPRSVWRPESEDASRGSLIEPVAVAVVVVQERSRIPLMENGREAVLFTNLPPWFRLFLCAPGRWFPLYS